MEAMWCRGVLKRAIEEGHLAAALVDRDGSIVGLAGDITDEESTPLAAAVMSRLERADLSPRDVVTLMFGDRRVAVGLARAQLFVVAVVRAVTPAALEGVRQLCDRIGVMLANHEDAAPPWPRSSGGGTGSGPAGLPLIELGITVRRERGKA